jgi:hypothetical protein
MDFFEPIKPSDANKICKKCESICYAVRFQQNFENWTSGNNDIDKFIQNSQLSAHEDAKGALEWIPCNRLYNIEYIANDEFGNKYKANWIDGFIMNWNNENQNWKRDGKNLIVNLKSLNIPNNLTLVFTNEV